MTVRSILWRATALLSLLLLLNGCEPSDSPEKAGASADLAMDGDDLLPLSEVKPIDIAELADNAFKELWPQLTDARSGDLDELLTRGEIRILTTFSLGQYYIDKGTQRGLTFESIREMEAFFKKKLGKKKTQLLKFTIIPVRRDQLIPFLMEGYGDIAFANLTITEHREQVVDFSLPFSSRVREMFVTHSGEPPLTSLDELSGREIHVRFSSSYYESLVALNRDFEQRRVPLIRIVPVDPRLEDEDVLELVNDGILPATVADEHKLDLWRRVFKGLQVHDDIPVREGGKVALAFRQDSPKLKAVLDEFAHSHRVGTLIANTLLKRYFGNTNWVKTAEERDPFRGIHGLTKYFKTYGEQYEIDWLLLAAFAYQESHFNTKARSGAGAVGVMQILPRTAKAIGFPDISGTQNNIHAGTKYLARLRDHYFDDENIEPFEKLLFTMAGYNAGPTRINRLRREAEQRGLNPNRWFNNVELVVAAKVGREPVRYVGNIYRYYVAYKRSVYDLNARMQAIQAVQE
ncbi:transporter substrate-binding domain-containing protein [Corallincola luteus]|uniref:Transporter substrate-binding domain-containing protein n=1 Tax=Corallincola luteus TaxID=1775177 RepID=A0ABY2AGV4_9GAMM|nr:transglycosylase SLT domain-containing protein [Corallincola luteus]TCI01790.1 transporter substrate-binding domain-containing protein [Corallincola luteus]